MQRGLFGPCRNLLVKGRSGTQFLLLAFTCYSRHVCTFAGEADGQHWPCSGAFEIHLGQLQVGTATWFNDCYLAPLWFSWFTVIWKTSNFRIFTDMSGRCLDGLESTMIYTGGFPCTPQLAKPEKIVWNILKPFLLFNPNKTFHQRPCP